MIYNNTIVIEIDPKTFILNISELENIINDTHNIYEDSEIFLQINLLPEDMIDKKEEYNEFKNIILWNCFHKWKNVLPFICSSKDEQDSISQTIRETAITSNIIYK